MWWIINVPLYSAHNKELFVDTELHIAHGRRYGLVGPNGECWDTEPEWALDSLVG